MDRVRKLKRAANRLRLPGARQAPDSGVTALSSVDIERKDDEEVSIAQSSTYSSDSATMFVDMYNYNSPYAEVRASVPNYDDESMPQNTVRMWVIGLLLLSGITVINTEFFIHDPPLRVKSYFTIVLAWLLGWIWEHTVPNIWGLNPGKFTYKEHSLIAVLALTPTASIITDTAISLTYYNESSAFGSKIVCAVLFSWAAELLGICLAILATEVLVDPPAMVWPTELVVVTLLSNMHIKWNHVANGWRITRQRFFLVTCTIFTTYEFFTHFFFKFLGQFSVFSWISPDNYVVNQLFGTFSGAGMLPVCFDWNTVGGFYMSPLIPPARVFANVALAIVLIMWFACSGVHYSNVWWGQYLPFADFKLFDRFGDQYDIKSVIKDFVTLDTKKFHEYSAVFLPNTRIIGIGMGLAAATSVIVYTLLFETPRLFSYITKRPRDIHSRLMQKYERIPYWWCGVLFALSVAIVYPSTQAFDTHIPGWYPIVAIVGTIIWFLPVAVAYASTTIYINLTSFSQVLTGYLSQDRVLAMMMFKDWSNNAIDAGVEFAGMLKLGHYTKLRPKLVLFVRLVGFLWAGILQIVLLVSGKHHVPQHCRTDQTSVVCAESQTVYTDSLIYGVVGSKNIMHIYGPVLHFLWIGALVPVLSWMWLRLRPRSKLRIMHWPIFFNIFQRVPPATPYNLSCWVIIGIVFSYWIRRYWHSWWAKYCYTLSAALDFSLVVVQLVIYFALTDQDSFGPSWWGNTGFRNNIDGQYEPMKRPAPGNSFGPSKW